MKLQRRNNKRRRVRGECVKTHNWHSCNYAGTVVNMTWPTADPFVFAGAFRDRGQLRSEGSDMKTFPEISIRAKTRNNYQQKRPVRWIPMISGVSTFTQIRVCTKSQITEYRISSAEVFDWIYDSNSRNLRDFYIFLETHRVRGHVSVWSDYSNANLNKWRTRTLYLTQYWSSFFVFVGVQSTNEFRFSNYDWSTKRENSKWSRSVFKR